MDGLEYFSLYRNTLDYIEPLTDEERGQLFTAICEYAFTGVLPSVDGGVKYIFPVFKVAIDKCADKVADLSAKRSEAGKHGGRPKKQTDSEESKKTNCFSEKANESKKRYIDKDKDTDTDKDIDKDKDINISNGSESDAEFVKIAQEQNDVLAYAERCGMARNESERYRLIDLYSQYGLDAMKVGFDECVTHGATTIAYLTAVLKGQKNGSKSNGFTQRTYSNDTSDMDALMNGHKKSKIPAQNFTQRPYKDETNELVKQIMEWDGDDENV